MQSDRIILSNLHIQVERETDAKVVGISEGFLGHPRPLFCDHPHLVPGLHRDHRELHISAAADGADWT